MKHVRFFILTILIPLLFTSCLADYLNEKFGYSAPIYVSYESKFGQVPSRKLINKGTGLTSEYLPVLYASDNEFEGWYMDSNFKDAAQEGYVVNESITLYAKWKYDDTKYQQTQYVYEVHFCLFDADNTDYGFVYHSEYTQSFDSEAKAKALICYFNGYEYIPDADATYTSYDSYTNGQLTKLVTVIEKHYYKTHIQAGSFKETYYYLSGYPDFTYTFYITDYAPELSSLTDYPAPPNVCLHLENCYGLTEIPTSAFASKNWLREIYLPSSITKIDSLAFGYCYNLRYIQLEYGITEIGTSSFNKCTSLESIFIPDSVTTINNYAFSNCTSLIDVSLPEFITKIPANCFEYCTSLESIKIPKQVEEIITYSFNNCDSLSSIYLPASLKKISAYAFKDCPLLTDVYYEGTAVPTTLQILDDTINAIKGTENWHNGSY